PVHLPQSLDRWSIEEGRADPEGHVRRFRLRELRPRIENGDVSFFAQVSNLVSNDLQPTHVGRVTLSGAINARLHDGESPHELGTGPVHLENGVSPSHRILVGA